MFWKTIIEDKIPEIIWGIIFLALIWGIGYLVSQHQNTIE